MDSAHDAQPTGDPVAELAALAERFSEQRKEIEGLPGASFDKVSVCANDGKSMYASLADTGSSEPGEAGIGQYPLGEVTQGLERIEAECLALKRKSSPAAARKLAAMDQEVVKLLEQHSDASYPPSSYTAVHTQFAGRKGKQVWSVYLETEPIRAFACGADAGSLCTELFGGRDRAEDGGPLVHFADPADSGLPLAVFLSRHMQQLRAQGLNPSVVLVANRGILISAATGTQLEEMYETIAGRIAAFASSHEGADLFEKPYPLAGQRDVLEAEKAFFVCAEYVEMWHSWVPEKGSELHQLLCSPAQLKRLREGFPTETLVRYGGGAALVVEQGKADSADRLARSIEAAWEKYREHYVDKLHVVPKGETYIPKIVLIEGVSAITVGESDDDLAQAYAVLQETIALMAAAAPFGGLRPLSERQQQLVLMSG